MLDATVLIDSKVKKQGYKAIMDYKINKDYDIVKLRNIINEDPRYKKEIINGSYSFDDFKNETALMGTRITLKNELKISDTEALNYLMGFPLNFNLELFVKLLFDKLFDNIRKYDSINENIDTNINKNKYLINRKTEITDVGHFARLKFDFDKKKKLIRQNFESTTHIDVKEFKDWAESRCFIIKKSQ